MPQGTTHCATSTQSRILWSRCPTSQCIEGDNQMRQVYERCAGLDVHKKSVVACRAQVTAAGQWVTETQTFGTMTRDLLGLLDWLQAWAVTHVAMESTGDYWKPVFNLLEGNLTVLLV